MSKNVKTIKELADELGTNKTRISRIINKNSISTQKIKNKNCVRGQFSKSYQTVF